VTATPAGIVVSAPTRRRSSSPRPPASATSATCPAIPRPPRHRDERRRRAGLPGGPDTPPERSPRVVPPRVDRPGELAARRVATDQRVAATDKSEDRTGGADVPVRSLLLIASSRPGDQPANLQGIWNDRTNPPWGSKYTTNINTEMNYWPAEVANLAECAEPLFGMLDDLVVSGRETRVRTTGSGLGAAPQHRPLARTAPINASNHGIWPTAGPGSPTSVGALPVLRRREFLARRAYRS